MQAESLGIELEIFNNGWNGLLLTGSRRARLQFGHFLNSKAKNIHIWDLTNVEMCSAFSKQRRYEETGRFVYLYTN